MMPMRYPSRLFHNPVIYALVKPFSSFIMAVAHDLLYSCKSANIARMFKGHKYMLYQHPFYARLRERQRQAQRRATILDRLIWLFR